MNFLLASGFLLLGLSFKLRAIPNTLTATFSFDGAESLMSVSALGLLSGSFMIASVIGLVALLTLFASNRWWRN
ncbi:MULTISPECIES: hypothetical protein [Pseudoalteromonas]|jgi:hypothetical protein|nr:MULTISPECIES: hypothetical protein [Pseudoalteromonas]